MTKCLIVDDEPLAIEVIQSHMAKINSFEVAATCQNAIEAFNIISKSKIDLIFLDIQMPGLKGTDFLRTLKNPPKVIITTAYREYALEGFELDVVDYLLKPISFERFFKAINKYLNFNSGEIIIHHDDSQNDTQSFIYVKSNKKINKIMLSDILYVESIKDYITIYSTTRTIKVKHTISEFWERLPETGFIRIHRSFIVSIKQITGFTANCIEINDIELPIGRNYKELVFNALKYNPFNA